LVFIVNLTLLFGDSWYKYQFFLLESHNLPCFKSYQICMVLWWTCQWAGYDSLKMCIFGEWWGVYIYLLTQIIFLQCLSFEDTLSIAKSKGYAYIPKASSYYNRVPPHLAGCLRLVRISKPAYEPNCHSTKKKNQHLTSFFKRHYIWKKKTTFQFGCDTGVLC
jgi:hypothetical protein